MVINNLSIISASLDLDADIKCPICMICGHGSDTALDLIREVMGDQNGVSDPDGLDDGRFVIHVELVADNRPYSVCYLRNSDFLGDRRLAVNFASESRGFSCDDTEEYMGLMKKFGRGDSCVFDGYDIGTTGGCISESDRLVFAFEEFSARILSADDLRPVFIYNFYGRIDRVVDIESLLLPIMASGRQVFISCDCENIDLELSKSVQIISF